MPSPELSSRYFFTLGVKGRSQNVLSRHIALLGGSLRKTAEAHPFKVLAMVVLPEHLHCIMEFPEGDDDHALRWKSIQSLFSNALAKNEFLSRSRLHRRDRGIWQRQYKSYKIHTEVELRYGMAYIHRDPVKHGLVSHEQDWPYSTYQSLGAKPRLSAVRNKKF